MSTERTYPADQVDAQVELLSAGAQEALQEKQAAEAKLAERDAEVAELREKLAQAESSKVELEKVASAPFKFDDSEIKSAVEALTEKDILVPEAREETMQKLASNPGYALDMLKHFATFNVAPLVQPRGGGVDSTPKMVKAASAARDDDWFEEPSAAS